MVIAEYTIQPLTSKYVQAITDLSNRLLKFKYDVPFFLQFLYRKDSVCMLALDDKNSVIGAIAGKLKKSDTGIYSGHIYILAVIPEYRRKGLGKHLVDDITNQFISLCASNDSVLASIHLEAIVGDVIAHSFYQYLGFASAGTVSSHGLESLQKLLVS